MLNGLLTLRGAWDRVRQDPILKFMVVAVTAYGMSTFEGPMLSIKSVNAISHFTDWTIGHVHIGTLGWNGFLTFGVLYWLIPRLYNTRLHSVSLANAHFWIGTLGILFYAIPLYGAGWTQALMWKQFTPDGVLAYPNFLETVTQILPMYAMRAFGGTLYLTGVIIMVVNLWKTMAAGQFVGDEEAEAPALEPHVSHGKEYWHKWIERKPVQMLIVSLIMVLIGGIVEIAPMMFVSDNVPKIKSVEPYTPLELAGRDLYIREGCLGCHSQMIRPFRSETERYGEYSKSGEFIYDRPFLWGSKRTGPDLHRIGGKYNEAWHYNHMLDPQSISPQSIMPRYPWLHERILDTSLLPAKIRTLRSKPIGTPYAYKTDEDILKAVDKQAKEIADNLREQLPNLEDEQLEKREIIALIAYLERLGTDIKK